MSYVVMLLILSGLAALVCWSLTGRLICQLRMDVPNARSSHKAPVPRGGGLAVLICFLPCAAAVIYALLEQGFLSQSQTLPWVTLGAGVVALGIVSWFDDRHALPVIVRLAVQAGCVGMMLMVMEPVTITADWLPVWLDRLLIFVLWVGFVNLFNFMDGIDGLAVTESLSILIGLILLAVLFGGLMPESMAAAALAGAMLGFGVWNWRPARVFLGDVGSVPVGFVLGFLLLRLAGEGYGAAAIIFPLYYLADGGLTFLGRLCRGEAVWQAHRQHVYQRAALALGRHDAVVVRIMAANLALILITLAGWHYPAAYLLAPLVVATLLWNLHRARPARQKKA